MRSLLLSGRIAQSHDKFATAAAAAAAAAVCASAGDGSRGRGGGGGGIAADCQQQRGSVPELGVMMLVMLVTLDSRA